MRPQRERDRRTLDSNRASGMPRPHAHPLAPSTRTGTTDLHEPLQRTPSAPCPRAPATSINETWHGACTRPAETRRPERPPRWLAPRVLQRPSSMTTRFLNPTVPACAGLPCGRPVLRNVTRFLDIG